MLKLSSKREDGRCYVFSPLASLYSLPSSSPSCLRANELLPTPPFELYPLKLATWSLEQYRAAMCKHVQGLRTARLPEFAAPRVILHDRRMRKPKRREWRRLSALTASPQRRCRTNHAWTKHRICPLFNIREEALQCWIMIRGRLLKLHHRSSCSSSARLAPAPDGRRRCVDHASLSPLKL